MQLARKIPRFPRALALRSLGSRVPEGPPELDARGRRLEGAAERVETLREQLKLLPNEQRMKQAALVAGGASVLAGLLVGGCSQAPVVFTLEHLSMGLLLAGGGALGYAFRDHDLMQKAFFWDEGDSNKSARFSFQLMNESNAFSKEMEQLESLCQVKRMKWPEEVKKRLNELLTEDATRLESEISERRKAMAQQLNESSFSSAKEALSYLSPKVYVVDYFDPDPTSRGLDRFNCSRAEQFGEEVTMILTCATKYDNVVINLQSPGGAVQEFGLAASHMLRLKESGIRTIVTVDKVAASGGFMLACCADEIVAAPFSFIGSIGVVAQIPNISRVLSKNDVEWNLFTAGKFKRTMTVFSENTDEGREKFQEEIEAIHTAFKDHVNENRGNALDIEKVATGEAWLALQGKEHGLVDRLATSSAVLREYGKNGFDIVKISIVDEKEGSLKKMFNRAVAYTEAAFKSFSSRSWTSAVAKDSGQRHEYISLSNPYDLNSRYNLK